MHVGKHDDIALKRDNGDGGISLVIEIDKDGNGAKINKCLTIGYGNTTKIGIKVHIERKRRQLENHTT